MITNAPADAPLPAPPARPSMKSLLQGPFVAVWCVLIAATMITWYLGSDHGIPNHHVATVVILLVAFVKVRFVGLYFMELRDAPALLRGIFEAHCILVCSALVVVYLTAPLAAT